MRATVNAICSDICTTANMSLRKCAAALPEIHNACFHWHLINKHAKNYENIIRLSNEHTRQHHSA